MPSEKTDLATQREWRELGFYYELDQPKKKWRLVGSKAGLLHFAKLIQAYVADPRNQKLSEHEHYGPYMYLEVGTWDKAEITDHWIAGPLDKLATLAQEIEQKITGAAVGDIIDVGHGFAPSSDVRLILEVSSDSFDPASADSHCWSKSG